MKTDVPRFEDAPTRDAERRQTEELRARLDEALELLDAIRSGEVDAVVVGGDSGDSQVYTLVGADRPYRMLVEQMREGALTLSVDGIVMYANDSIAKLLGVPSGGIVGHQFRSFIAPTHREQVRYERLLGGGKGELTVRSTDGLLIPVQFSVNNLPPEEIGGQQVLCVVVTDLTEEKRQATELAGVQARAAAEAARLEGERFARLILDSATDYAIIATDRAARITSWNSGAVNLFGWRPEDLTGQTADRIWTPEDQTAGVPAAEMERALETGRADDERWHLRRDGSRFWASGLMMPLRGGNDEHLGYIKILRDRTESRRIEAALRESEARLRFTLGAGRLGAWEQDLVTGTLTASEICRINFGRTPDDSFTYQDLRETVHPDDRERMLGSVERAIVTRSDYDIEYRVVTSAGEVRWVQIRARPIYAEDGTPLSMAGISLDITDRRLAEAQLQRLNETLEARVMQEVATRSRAEEALRQSQKMEAVGQLTGGVAHDFNNLLTIIKSSTDLLRRPGLAEDRRSRYVTAISDTVDRAAKLTGQLLAFARRQALKPEVFDVAERVNEISDMLRTIVGSRIDLQTDFACEGQCLIEADVSQFETALVNMAVNARDAMDGAGTLKIAVESSSNVPAIRAHAGAVGPFIAVQISDTGSGIAPDKLPQIFEPFYTTKQIGKGTGLGLSQVYGFAKQSGGDVAAESEVGRGSTFTLYLPRVERDLAPKPASTRPDAHGEHGAGHHVLVVEDNLEVGAFSTQLLQDLGFQTTWAASGQEALQLLEDAGQRFDIVFTDVVMPGISGVELGLEIRRRYPGLPVVLTSGYSHVLAEEGRHGFELVHKPYAVDDVSRVLRRVFRERALLSS